MKAIKLTSSSQKYVILIFSSASFTFLCSCVASPGPLPPDAVLKSVVPPPDPDQWEKEEQNQETEHAALAQWTDCQFREMKQVASTDTPAPEAVNLGYNNCHQSRENWVNANVVAGWNRQATENEANQLEECTYLMWQEYIEHLRVEASMTADQNEQWRQNFLIEHRTPCLGSDENSSN